jgi:hypothetical protein
MVYRNTNIHIQRETNRTYRIEGNLKIYSNYRISDLKEVLSSVSITTFTCVQCCDLIVIIKNKL